MCVQKYIASVFDPSPCAPAVAAAMSQLRSGYIQLGGLPKSQRISLSFPVETKSSLARLSGKHSETESIICKKGERRGIQMKDFED